jgi:hypothetical protein
MAEQDKRIGEDGAKDRGRSLDGPDDDPALRQENRQAVKNQGEATPQDYPDRHEKTPADPGGDMP